MNLLKKNVMCASRCISIILADFDIARALKWKFHLDHSLVSKHSSRCFGGKLIPNSALAFSQCSFIIPYHVIIQPVKGICSFYTQLVRSDGLLLHLEV